MAEKLTKYLVTDNSMIEPLLHDIPNTVSLVKAGESMIVKTHERQLGESKQNINSSTKKYNN